jgi:transposase InsO family protein
MVNEGLEQHDEQRSRARLTAVLKLLEIRSSSWYHEPRPAERRRRPGPPPKPIPPAIEKAIVAMAMANPWYGYKRIAVMCRRDGEAVADRQCYKVMKQHGLLQKRKPRAAEVYQTARLFELLPSGPNELWQMDVTYIHIPGCGWWYAVTVIDYYSRYLLAAHLTPSYSAAAATEALALARREAERLCGPLERSPFLVTDNGSTFIAKRFVEFVRDDYCQVRIAYRTPTQLGLLERFHRTLKEEEVYWRLYDSPAHARDCLAEFRERYNRRRPHWALIPERGGDPVTPEEVYTGRITPKLPRWQGWAKAAREKLDKMMQPAA